MPAEAVLLTPAPLAEAAVLAALHHRPEVRVVRPAPAVLQVRAGGRTVLVLASARQVLVPGEVGRLLGIGEPSGAPEPWWTDAVLGDGGRDLLETIAAACGGTVVP